MKYNFELDLSTANSLSILASRIKPGSTVLEFGPASGRFTKYLKQYLGCIVYIVELDPDSAAQASLFAEKTLVGNIENYEWLTEFAHVSFDYIVFADVLEHLIQPRKVLQNCNKLLKENGSVLISIPNVGHSSIVINLFNNKFEYQKIGLLDETHLKFFTKENLEMMIDEAGYKSIYKNAVYKYLEETEFNVYFDQLPKALQYDFKNRAYGNVYQFVYEIKNKETSSAETDNRLETYADMYFSQLYFDTGEGFSEERSLKKPLSVTNRAIRLEIKREFRSQPLQRLRFDFINSNAILKMQKIYAVDKDSLSHPLLWNESNHHFNRDELFIYSTEDPYLIFDKLPDKEITEIVIELEFLQVDFYIHDAVYQAITDQKYTIDEQHQNILRMEIDSNTHLEELNALKAQMKAVQLQMNEAAAALEELKAERSKLNDLLIEANRKNNTIKAFLKDEKDENQNKTIRINELEQSVANVENNNKFLRDRLLKMLYTSPYKRPSRYLKLRREYRSTEENFK